MHETLETRCAEDLRQQDTVYVASDSMPYEGTDIYTLCHTYTEDTHLSRLATASDRDSALLQTAIRSCASSTLRLHVQRQLPLPVGGAPVSTAFSTSARDQTTVDLLLLPVMPL